jgi:ketosteroid isomerase-like protein
MKKLILTLLIGACAYWLIGCTTANTPAANTASNAGNAAPANSNIAAKPAPAAASVEAIAALEKSGWEAWKNKDMKAFEDILSDRIVGFGKDGREDKAGLIKAMTADNCDVKSYSFSDQKLTNLGSDVAVLTFKSEQDAVCAGKKAPSPVYSTTVYVREGDKWKNILYMESPVVDPKTTKFATPPPAPKATATSDALTDQLMAVEKTEWEAWKTRDRKALESAMTSNFAVSGGYGYNSREDILKRWSEPKCKGLDYTFADAKGFNVTPDVTLVTYRADVKGSCDDGPIAPSMWVASFDMKEGGEWKNAFYVDRPRS